MENLREKLETLYNNAIEDNDIELCGKIEEILKTESLISFNERQVEIGKEGLKCVQLITKTLIKRITENPIYDPIKEFKCIRDKVIQESKPHIRPHVIYYVNNHYKFLS